jgi:hypothetical protein
VGDINEWILDEFRKAVLRAEEDFIDDILVGSGSGEPRGILTTTTAVDETRHLSYHEVVEAYNRYADVEYKPDYQWSTPLRNDPYCSNRGMEWSQTRGSTYDGSVGLSSSIRRRLGGMGMCGDRRHDHVLTYLLMEGLRAGSGS